MHATTIIDEIETIYDEYNTPPPIQQHMRRVAGVAAVITNAWNDNSLNTKVIIAECLLHDMGNIAKITFDSELDRKLFSNLDTEYWKDAREEMIKQYGSDPHDITLQIADELDVSDRLRYLLEHAEFINTDAVVASDDWELKICTYADQRVAPNGVVPLEERLNEAAERYANDSEVGQVIQELRDDCRALEHELFTHVTIAPDDVTQGLKELDKSWMV